MQKLSFQFTLENVYYKFCGKHFDDYHANYVKFLDGISISVYQITFMNINIKSAYIEQFKSFISVFFRMTTILIFLYTLNTQYYLNCQISK